MKKILACLLLALLSIRASASIFVTLGGIQYDVLTMNSVTVTGLTSTVRFNNGALVPVSAADTPTLLAAMSSAGFVISGTVTSDQGAPNSTANAWPVKITDGTNTAAISVAGAVKVDGSAVTQPVSGTFFQATQPVSGTVAVSNFPASQAVTGTFFQATQPVSGTFFQATQPVSGTVTANIGTSGALALDATLSAQNNIGRSTNPAAVADGAAVTPYNTRSGKRVTVAEGPRELKAHNTITLTTTTETTLIAAGGVGVFRDMIFLLIATSDILVANRVDIRDTTAGTVVLSIPLTDLGAGTVSAGSPIVIPFPSSWPQTTANSNWTAQLSATPTVGQSVRISILTINN